MTTGSSYTAAPTQQSTLSHHCGEFGPPEHSTWDVVHVWGNWLVSKQCARQGLTLWVHRLEGAQQNGTSGVLNHSSFVVQDVFVADPKASKTGLCPGK